jgi:peptidoglycan/LPS O-acetylase OafA/YrhL
MSYREYRDVRRFGSLDGLRCLSILMVIWHHAGGATAGLPLLRRGYTGVTFFFVISGFLIVTLLLRERDRTGTIAMGGFYLRRSRRIFPLYYTVLTIYLVLVLVTEADSRFGQQFLHNLPFFATYTSNLFVDLDDSRVIFYFAWSLAAEEQFYLVWPWIERFLGGRWAVAGAVALLGLSFVPGPAAVIAPGICLGVLLAHALHNPVAYQRIRRILGAKPVAPLCFALLFAALAIAEPGHPMGGLGIVAIMGLTVASCVVREDHGMARVLKLRPVVWLGMISYGVYLLHVLCLNIAQRVLAQIGLPDATVLKFLLALALVTAVASVSFKYYESFFQRLRLSGGWRARTAVPRSLP